MLQLLIADDEQDVRSGIREMIPWEENDICVCGEASNGKEAIHLIETLHPDIALLDICMPLLDGLKVAQYTHDRQLDMENIILSGHDEFSYAQQAMKQGVADYLLKPCKPEDILSAIVCCRDRLVKRRKQAKLLAACSSRSSVWMLESQFFTTSGQIPLDSHVSDRDSLPYLKPVRQERTLLDGIRTGAREHIPRLCEEFFSPFQNQPCTKANVVNASLSLLLEIYKICEISGIQPPGDMERYLVYEQLELFPSFQLLSDKVCAFAENVSVRIAKKMGGSSPVHSALRYIEEHYQEDIDLNMLAAHVHITPAYLSFMFKQITGINFIDHLNRKRIEKACALMKNLEYKAYEIADIVGYHDEKYFSKVFKKITGMSPSKYRKLNC